jgi:hypothetical protein
MQNYRSNELNSCLQSIHSTTIEYTFFSEAHGTFSEIALILGLKISLNKYKEIILKAIRKIISCIYQTTMG